MIISLWNRPRKKVTALRVAIGKAVEEELGKIERRGRPKAEHPDQGELIEEEEIRQNFDELSGKRTDEIAAKKAGFGSEFTYRQAKAVTEKATPELVAAMDQGTIAISTAAKLAGQSVETQKQAVADPGLFGMGLTKRYPLARDYFPLNSGRSLSGRPLTQFGRTVTKGL